MSGQYGGTGSHRTDEFTQSAITVTTVPVELCTGGSRNPARYYIRIYNDGNTSCFIGPSGVTASGVSKGEELLKKQSMELELGDVGLFAVTASSTTTIIVSELA